MTFEEAQPGLKVVIVRQHMISKKELRTPTQISKRTARDYIYVRRGSSHKFRWNGERWIEAKPKSYAGSSFYFTGHLEPGDA